MEKWILALSGGQLNGRTWMICSIMKGSVRRLFNDSAARHRGECLKQAIRERKQGRKRANTEWDESWKRSMKIHRRELENNC